MSRARHMPILVVLAIGMFVLMCAIDTVDEDEQTPSNQPALNLGTQQGDQP